MRIGDTEREQALAALGEHMSAGRLNIDEYGERSAKVTAARTRSELVDVFTDLPSPRPGDMPPPQPAAASQAPAAVSEAAVEKRGNGSRISMAAVAAASWPVAIGVGLLTRQWEVMAVPVLLSWFMGALFGGRRHDEERDQHRRHRDQWRQERHEMRDQMRRQIRGRD
jgi:hypothetical protein